MVEKLLSSSCIRSITAVSLKPPPEPFSAATTVAAAAVAPAASPRHQAYSSLPTIENVQRETTKATGAAFARVTAPILGLIWSLEECRTVESHPDREGFNSDLTHRHFRRSAPLKDVIGLFWGGRVHWLRKIFFLCLALSNSLYSPSFVFIIHICRVGWHPSSVLHYKLSL